MTSQLYCSQAKTTLQIACPDTPQPRTSDRIEKRTSQWNTWNSFHGPLYLMQSHSRKYMLPPPKTIKPLSNFSTPDAGMKSQSLTLTRPHWVNCKTSDELTPNRKLAAQEHANRNAYIATSQSRTVGPRRSLRHK